MFQSDFISYKKRGIEMEKLKVGDIFIVYSSELKCIDLSCNGSFLLKCINSLDEYDFPLVTFMCRYLGDNICEEYYSGIKMQINYPLYEDQYYVSIYAKQSCYRSFDNIIDKSKNFRKLDQYVLEYPLIIEPVSINDVHHYVVCDNNSRENTIDVINKLNNMAKNRYLVSKKEFIEGQYDQAYVDDMVTSFKKKTLKKGE